VAELTEVHIKIRTAVGIGLRRLDPKSDNYGARRATSGAFSGAAQPISLELQGSEAGIGSSLKLRRS
jgi:hypothetical protein